MSFFRRLLERMITRSTTTSDRPAQWLIDWYRGGGPTASGQRVNATSAQKVAAVYACVQLVSQDVAKLPLPLYRRKENGDRERVDTPLARLVGEMPNEWQTSFEWREMLQGHVELRGNGYSYIEMDARGRAIALWPMHPDCVTPMLAEDGRTLFYQYREPPALGGETKILSQDEVLHIRSRTEDGICGVSRIQQAREAIGLALAMEKHGARLFSNGAMPSIVLETDKKFASQEEADRAREIFMAAYSGEANAWKPMIAHNGLTAKQLSMTSDDSQFIQSRAAQVTEIARWFRVPPHKIGDLSQATFSNIEHQAIEYVVDALHPRLRAFEARLNAGLLPAGGSLYFEFLIDGLLRGDLKSRYEAYGLARQWGFMSVNDIRKLENLSSIGKQGDIYLTPANMTDASKPMPAPAPTPPAAPADAPKPPDAPTAAALIAARGLIDEMLARKMNGAGKEGHGHA